VAAFMLLDLKSDFSHTSTVRVSRGRLTDAHDEVRYVVRKP
jgi:hypothetical protein